MLIGIILPLIQSVSHSLFFIFLIHCVRPKLWTEMIFMTIISIGFYWNKLNGNVVGNENIWNFCIIPFSHIIIDMTIFINTLSASTHIQPEPYWRLIEIRSRIDPRNAFQLISWVKETFWWNKLRQTSKRNFSFQIHVPQIGCLCQVRFIL